MDIKNQNKKRKSQEDSDINTATSDGTFPRFLVLKSLGIEKQLSALIGMPKSVKSLGPAGF